MKVIQRVPLDQFAYIEFEDDYPSAEDAIVHNADLVQKYQGGMGLPVREWTKVRKTMLSTGECDPELIEQMNKAQRFWVNETKKTLRAISGEDEIHNT